MPIYDYKAKSPTGEIVDDRIEAESKPAAIVSLQNQRLVLLDIQEVPKEGLSFQRRKVKRKELAGFCKQLGQLVETGISVHHGIELIGEYHKNRYFKEVLDMMVRDLKGGISVSRAAERHARVFPSMMIQQLRAAEEGGFLVEALKNLANDLEREIQFTKQIRGAAIYPSAIIVVTILALWYMMTMIVPTMSQTLVELEVELPALTQIVIGFSEFVKRFWYIAIIAVATAVFLFMFLYKQENYRLIIDRYLIRLPLIGPLIAVINLARISRIMSSLLGSGVSISQTLENANKVLTNHALKKAIQEVREDVVSRGATLSRALEKHEYFPKTFVQIVSIGEETGGLTEVLGQLAAQYEGDVADSLKTVTAVINPILMIAIGIVVGVVVVAMFLPMFSLMNSL